MTILRIWAILKSGIKSYFTNTSVHGFRYAVETPNKLLKAYWATCIVLAFGMCAMMALNYFDHLVQNPIISTRQEMVLDDLPPPAISISVPQVQGTTILRMRMANSIRACDPLVNISSSAILGPFLEVTRALNDAIRKTYEPTDEEMIQYKSQLPTSPEFGTFQRFCGAMLPLKKASRKALVKELATLTDNYLLVTDVEAMLDSGLPREKELDGCMENGIIRKWMELISPLKFRETYSMTCSDR